MKNKAQVSLFIIGAIAIIVALGLFFFLKGETGPTRIGGKEVNTNSFLESCLENKIQQTTEIISEHGGYIENNFSISFKFDDEETHTPISYLCYNKNYYLPCVNQEPLLIQHLKEEIKNEIETDVEDCFNEFVLSLEKEAYEVQADYHGFEVDLAPKKIIVNVEGEISKTKSGETTKQEEFGVIIQSRFYDIATIVQEIVYQEGKHCNFDILGFMMLYPDVKIEKFRTTDSITIYRLVHRDSEEKFKFAVRSCVIPPGI